MPTPLISCICVTKEELALPYHCFRSQTHPNLELVLVHENEAWKEPLQMEPIELEESLRDEEELQEWPAEGVFLDQRVKSVFVPPEPKKHLAELYNIGVQAAKGEYIAIWDSDDWSAPERIERQFEELSLNKFKFKGCVLLRWCIFDHVAQQAYLTKKKRLWEGSLVMQRDVLAAHPYPPGPGFDTKVVGQWKRHILQLDAPELMIYSRGLDNWTGSEHGQLILRDSSPLSDDVSREFALRFQEASKELLAQ